MAGAAGRHEELAHAAVEVAAEQLVGAALAVGAAHAVVAAEAAVAKMRRNRRESKEKCSLLQT